MQKDNTFDTVISDICKRKLHSAIKGLENYILSNPQVQSLDKLVTINVDYDMMAEYWKRGVNDPERNQVYEQLLHRLHTLTMNISITQHYRSSSYWMSLYQSPRKNGMKWGLSSVRNELEGFVSDMAVIDLEPEHIRKVKQNELNIRHHSYINDLFNYILTSHMWSEEVGNQFVDILVTPTVDTCDQQLIVSAITLATLNAFDVNKVLTLIRVYSQSSDVHVKQRALVGWTLTIDEKKDKLYPELKCAIADVCTDESVCQELTELQMQLYFCMEAEKDQKKIHDEIMPEIMNGSRIKITQKGLVEMDEDTLEDILHPDAAERDMEKMEQSVMRMAEMQKQGSDIYYAGFSQMKRFPFFNELSNWFVPFYTGHPAITNIWNNTKGKRFLQSLTAASAFCDGDKYSFVLAFEQVLSHLPAQMMKMVENGEASPMAIGGIVDSAEQNTPAYVRRMYLQNLYRFFRLFPMRQEFHNPFDDRNNYLFFANNFFTNTPIKMRLFEMVAFLIKRQKYYEAESVLVKFPDEQDYQYCMLRAHIIQFDSLRSWNKERTLYENALERKPGDRKAMAGLARAHYGMEQYNEALEIYNRLLEEVPDSKSYMLNAAICMVNLRQSQEALKLLYKLNYLYPDDMTVIHVLAWALTLENRYEDALKLYKQLTTQKHPNPDNFLNYGYCLWLKGDVAEAIQTFHYYSNLVDNGASKLEDAFMEAEHDILNQHHINDDEIKMMLDAATS